MRLLDILLLSWRQLKERKLRSILTMLAVAVGVTTIIALSAQVEGAKLSIIESLGKLGPDTIIVNVRSRPLFIDADVARLKGLEGVSKVTPILTLPNVKVAGLQDAVTLVGVSSVDIVDFLGEVKLIDGSLYFDVPAPQALIGYNIAVDDTGQSRYKAGQPILVQSQRPLMLMVVGVLDTYGTAPIMILSPDKTVFMPIEYAKSLITGGGYTVILVKAGSIENVDQVSELIGYLFGARASVTSIKQITEIVVRITSQINVLLLAIAGTSFIAAGLGTLNVMMISVLERVREIGILKALGMKDKGVLLLYMSQGALIGLFGSLVGLVLGCGLAYLLPILVEGAGFGQGQGLGPGQAQAQARIPLYTPIISPLYIGVATAASLAVTLLASAYPARRASRLRPVEALRYE